MASNIALKNKSAIEQFRKNLEKRSLNVKFDLENTDYKAIENIGIGAYGVVCSAVHKKTNDKVAIKKIPNVFEALTITKRTYREIKILKHFKHDNIISIREILKPAESYKDFKEIYVVFDLMESDLHKIIYTDQELTEEHIRYFLYQILRGLKYIHSANVIHRDLKPSNLLVNEDCHIRIGDFGMSRGIFYERDEPAFFMTQYVATRWYRAPEILLSLIEYGTAVDMWSVGCIFAEMLGRKHLFPGKDYISQIKLIVGLLGSPSDELLNSCQNVIIRDIIKKLGQRTAIPWKTLFPKASKKALDLLSKMLVVNPANRISVDKALEHLFLNKYHDPDDEPICVPAFKFDFEKENMDKETLREVIYKEIMEYHQPRTPTFSFNAVLRPAPKSESSTLVLSPCPPIEKKQLDAQLKDFLQTVSCEPSYPDERRDSFSKHPVQSTDNLIAKPEKNKSPVTVDTSNLTSTQTSDVEMLSAKVSEGKTETPEVKLVPVVKKTDKENKPTEVSDTTNVTISLGTKERIKQALQIASERRQRTESGSEDSEKKPITAAQRQREREEKRKKKKDRALEKMKKVKEKKNTPVFILSDADKEMLQRWSQMQQVATGNSTVGGSNVAHTGTPGQTIIITSLSQTVLQPIVSNVQQQKESTGLPGQMVQPILPATSSVSTLVLSQVVRDSLVHSQTGVMQTTSTGHVMSTGHFQCSATNTGSNPANMEHDSVQKPEHQLQSCMFQSADGSNLPFQTQTSGLLTQTSVLHPQTSGLQTQTSSSLQQQHPYSQQQQQNVFTQMNQNGLGHTQMDQTNQAQSSNTLFSQDSQQLASHSMPPVTSVQGLSAFGQENNSSLATAATNLQSHTFSHQDPKLFHFPQGLSQSRSNVYSQDSGPQMGGFTQHQNQQQGMFAGVPFAPTETSASTTQQSVLSTSSQQPFSNFTSGSEHVCHTYNNPSSVEYVTTAVGAGVSGRTAWSPPNTDQFVQKTTLADSHTKHVSQLSQEQQTQDKMTPSSNRQPQDLKIKCSPPPRAPQVPANHQDLIALLSKQLMKSGMADPFPPALSLTPKGTGGGYGVGTDIDALMVDAHENIDVNRVEQSPLSSSLIADWLDISGNITQADLEALEREMEMQSPMSLSYSDFNLHNPP